MMRYGFSGAWRSFTTAGGGPAGGHARPRVPPPHPTTVRTVPLRIATPMRRATCIVSPSLRKCVVRRCPTRQPLPERVRVVGQAPLLEDRQGHGPHAALASTGVQALLVQPRLEFVGLGVGGDGSLEQDRPWGERAHGRDPFHIPFAAVADLDLAGLLARLRREVAEVVVLGLITEHAAQERNRPSRAAAPTAQLTFALEPRVLGHHRP